MEFLSLAQLQAQAGAILPALILMKAVASGLFTALAQGPLSAEELSKAIGWNARAGQRISDALVAMGALTKCDDHTDRYCNTPATDLYLNRRRTPYGGGFIEYLDLALGPSYVENMDEVLRTGQAPANRQNFQIQYASPREVEMFVRAMTSNRLLVSQALAELPLWEGYKAVVDIGCAEGGMLVEILKKHPRIQGIGFDLPEIQPFFDRHATETGLANRLQFQAGDAFTTPLPQADAYLTSHFFHDHGPEMRRQLARKICGGLPKEGILCVVEALLESGNLPAFLSNVNMLFETGEGGESTGQEYAEILLEAGFTQVSILPIAKGDSAIIATK